MENSGKSTKPKFTFLEKTNNLKNLARLIKKEGTNKWCYINTLIRFGQILRKIQLTKTDTRINMGSLNCPIAIKNYY